MSPATTLAITAAEGLHVVANAITTVLQMQTFRHFLYLHMDRHVLLVMHLMAKVSMAGRFLRDFTVAAIQVAIESVAAAFNSQALRSQIKSCWTG